MSQVITQMNCNTPVDIGSVLQCQLTDSQIGLASSIAASGSSISNAIITGGFKNFSFGIKSTQDGSISVQRYIDQAGTIPIGAAITGTITANTATSVNSTDSIPYQSLIITVTNSGSSTATISNSLLLLQAN